MIHSAIYFDIVLKYGACVFHHCYIHIQSEPRLCYCRNIKQLLVRDKFGQTVGGSLKN